MRCEVCGKLVFEKTLAEIDSTQLIVCEDCANLGTLVPMPKMPSSSGKIFIKQKSREPRIELDEGLDLRQDYGILVRRKRQELGLTNEELAKKIFEKESIVQKIENQKLVPSDAMVKKLEKALQLSLREKNQE